MAHGPLGVFRADSPQGIERHARSSGVRLVVVGAGVELVFVDEHAFASRIVERRGFGKGFESRGGLRSKSCGSIVIAIVG